MFAFLGDTISLRLKPQNAVACDSAPPEHRLPITSSRQPSDCECVLRDTSFGILVAIVCFEFSITIGNVFYCSPRMILDTENLDCYLFVVFYLQSKSIHI